MQGLRSNGRPGSSSDDENAPKRGEARSEPRSAAPLGGWRPASFRLADPENMKVPARSNLVEPASPRRAVSSASPALPSDGCKVGLAGLFSSTPPVEPPRLGTEGKDPSPRGARVETDRLVLRVLSLDDFDDYAAVAADDATFHFCERGPMTSDEAWTRLLRHVGHWSLMGWGMFAVEEKATGRFVGEAGLGDFRRGLGAPYDGVPEAAWTMARWAQGRGYATEAMQAALPWVEGRLAARRSVCLIHARNLASLRVAAKLGYQAFAERSYRGCGAVLLEREGGA